MGARRFHSRRCRFVFPRPTPDPPVYHWEIDNVRRISISSHSPSLELNYLRHFHTFLNLPPTSYE